MLSNWDSITTVLAGKKRATKKLIPFLLLKVSFTPREMHFSEYRDEQAKSCCKIPTTSLPYNSYSTL
jgi:hypothetical protein